MTIHRCRQLTATAARRADRQPGRKGGREEGEAGIWGAIQVGKKDRRGRVALFSSVLSSSGYMVAFFQRSCARWFCPSHVACVGLAGEAAAHAKKLKFSCNYGFRISPGFYWADIHPSTLPSSILSSFAQLIRLSPFPSLSFLSHLRIHSHGAGEESGQRRDEPRTRLPITVS